VDATGCYGAALARLLRSCGQVVLEVNRPDRAARRQHGKSDPLDAEAAARTVQAGEVTAVPKAGGGTVALLRSLRVTRATAVKARTQASNALKALIVTAPEGLREQLRGHSAAMLVRAAAALQPGKLDDPRPRPSSQCAVSPSATRPLTPRSSCSTANSTGWSLRPPLDLVARFGVGPDSAGALLVAAGDNPDRLRSEAAFSMLCGAWALEASSGKTRRHRRNRGGDRQANASLYRVVVVRLRWHQPTRDYMTRRLTRASPRLRSSAA
jgi:transposase